MASQYTLKTEERRVTCVALIAQLKAEKARSRPNKQEIAAIQSVLDRLIWHGPRHSDVIIING